MPDNVAASMTASIVLDKSDLLAQILKGLSEGQKELQNNKLEMYFDFSNSKNQAEFEKVIQKYRKQLSSQEFVVQIKDQGIDETVKSLDKLVEVVKSLASGKAFGTGLGNGKGIGNSIVDEKQLKTVINLFEKMESHLGSMRKVISDVGDGDEFSPLLTMINKVDSSISELAKKTSSLNLNMNLDFGSDDKMTAEVQSRTAKLLHTYENLFNRLKMSGTLDSNMQGYFDNFDINQYDNMNAKIAAYKNFITEMREMSKQQFGKDYLYSDIEKSYYSAVSGAQRSLNNIIKSENTSNNSIENLFGKTDLSEVISQLTIIVNKLDEISKSANNFTNVFKNGLDVNTSIQEVIDLTNRVKELETELAKIKNVTPASETNISSGRKDAFPDKDVSASVESATNSIKEENNVLEQNTQKVKENTQAKEQNANANLNKYDKRLDSYNGKVDKYQATIDRFNDGGWTSDAYLKNVQAVRDAVKQYATLLDNIKTNQNGIATDEDIQNLDKYEKKIKDTIATVTNMSASEKGYNFVSGQKELDKIHKLLNENSKMSSEAKAKIKAYYREIESGNPTMSLDKIHAEIMKIYNAEIEAGRAGRSLKDIFQTSRLHQMVAQVAGMFSFYDLINLGRQFASTVTDINTQITGLAKVSEQSSKQIYADFDSYADIAKEVRGTISDTIAATADWSKNGYSIPDAKQLAEVSQLYKNVGDGIDIDAANESLISTLKGFQLEADQAEHIVDVFNEVSNNEAISSGGIGEALQRSAASFNAASTSLEKSVSLVTATNSVLQDPEKVGNMWRTVSARLRGSETELKEMGEDTDGLVTSTSKLQALVKGITGFDIMKNKDTYKDIYDIVLGIGEKWQDLSDIDRASLLEALAGKQQSNALAAALSNIDILKKSYEEATNAEGSAREENEEYSKSIQASIDLTKAKLEELSNDLLSSNFLKGAIDAGGKLLELLDFIISDGREIPAIFTTIGAVIGAKKLSYASI
jgi:TP901 family phage tail tape measure protein|nr:MAG TPA: minor tail protein [Bacteriophage sp.]